MVRKLWLALLVALVLFTGVRATVHNVSVSGSAFNPAIITITQGDTVRWTNFDGVTHTATSDPGSIDTWDLSLPPGTNKQRQFNIVGILSYHCTPHPFMQGTVMVEQITDVRSNGNSVLPKKFRLLQNFPNPFNASTLISYQLPQTGEVTLTIYNILGQKVRIFQPGKQSAGSYSINWDGSNQEGSQVSSGIYFYRLRAGDSFNQVRKMTLIK